MPRLVAWLAIASAALLIAPAVANAVFVLNGHTSQGRSVRLRVSDQLSKVTRFGISWQAHCTSGATLIKGSHERAVVIPFPDFHFSASYITTAGSYSAARGRPLRYAVSLRLHGRLRFNGRARGTWTARVRVLDPNRKQIDSCSTGLIRWNASLA